MATVIAAGPYWSASRALRGPRSAVAPCGEHPELAERVLRVPRERQTGERVQRVGDEPLDAGLDLHARAGFDQHVLERADVAVGEIAVAEPAEQAGAGAGGPGRRSRHERRQLALAEVVTDRLARAGRVDELAVDGRSTTPAVAAVHDVVVHEGERVEELEGRARVDRDRIAAVTPGADVAPVAERGPEALASRGDERTQCAHGSA